MVCPNCQAAVAEESNFCPRCGTPFRKRNGFVANLWQENKPGFLILSLLLVAMMGSIGYFLYSRTGRFVVTVDGSSENEALAIVTTATLKEYCVHFPRECGSKHSGDLEKAIRAVLPRLTNPLKPGFGYAKIVYHNGSAEPVTITRFMYRRPPGTWTTGNSQALYEPKVQRLHLAMQTGGGNLPLQDKVDLALTTAVIKNHGSFTLSPNEQKVWRLSNVNHEAEFQVEYRQDGKTFNTPILRMK